MGTVADMVKHYRKITKELTADDFIANKKRGMEIKYCPYCGSDNLKHSNGWYKTIYCNNCGERIK